MQGPRCLGLGAPGLMNRVSARTPAALHLMRRRGKLVCSAARGQNPKAPVKVSLKIPYRVQFGQALGIVGAGDVLGHWDPTKAVRMEWSPGDMWVAEISVEPGTATQLEYKYVVIGKDGHVVTWKPGQNYKLDVLAARGTRVLVVETWDDGPRHVEVDVQGSDGNTIQLQAGASVIQQEAEAAMSELKEALDRQVQTMQRVTDSLAQASQRMGSIDKLRDEVEVLVATLRSARAHAANAAGSDGSDGGDEGAATTTFAVPVREGTMIRDKSGRPIIYGYVHAPQPLGAEIGEPGVVVDNLVHFIPLKINPDGTLSSDDDDEVLEELRERARSASRSPPPPSLSAAASSNGNGNGNGSHAPAPAAKSDWGVFAAAAAAVTSSNGNGNGSGSSVARPSPTRASPAGGSRRGDAGPGFTPDPKAIAVAEAVAAAAAAKLAAASPEQGLGPAPSSAPTVVAVMAGTTKGEAAMGIFHLDRLLARVGGRGEGGAPRKLPDCVELTGFAEGGDWQQVEAVRCITPGEFLAVAGRTTKSAWRDKIYVCENGALTSPIGDLLDEITLLMQLNEELEGASTAGGSVSAAVASLSSVEEEAEEAEEGEVVTVGASHLHF